MEDVPRSLHQHMQFSLEKKIKRKQIARNISLRLVLSNKLLTDRLLTRIVDGKKNKMLGINVFPAGNAQAGVLGTLWCNTGHSGMHADLQFDIARSMYPARLIVRRPNLSLTGSVLRQVTGLCEALVRSVGFKNGNCINFSMVGENL